MTQLEAFFPTRGAVLSDGAVYRYTLWRAWHDGSRVPRRCLFVMCNPSDADAERDDPTIRACVAFAQGWGFDRLDVGNLFAFRTPDVSVLRREYERGAPVVGPHNDQHLGELLDVAGRVVLAWGAKPWAADRVREVLGLVERRRPGLRDVYVLRLTQSGHPEHPLYVPRNTEPMLAREVMP